MRQSGMHPLLSERPKLLKNPKEKPPIIEQIPTIGGLEWSWWESNPRPDKALIRFLHA